MMICNLDKNLLQDLLDGVIDPVEKLFVEEHLKACSECRQEINELKLLFWDLNDKSSYDLELPLELDHIKNALLEQSLEPASQSTFNSLMEVQRKNIKSARNNMKSASKFLDFVPGIKAGNALAKESLKATPSALKYVSKSLLKTGKLLKAK
ncbi:zf-HC2 domain-containing protein [Desulfitobacterium sp. THU1]|uniref:anti-sigma factor family protein n=1 Tax=Desulfitobacterium sp. THU1 TaxID=3138072 RepID=UPI00311EA4E2